eukprot:m.920393 g.920393  ORF g.920393 m.920393 type:complete len:123 (+) comp64269_c0_seq1:224-592(+)
MVLQALGLLLWHSLRFLLLVCGVPLLVANLAVHFADDALKSYVLANIAVFAAPITERLDKFFGKKKVGQDLQAQVQVLEGRVEGLEKRVETLEKMNVATMKFLDFARAALRYKEDEHMPSAI